MGLSYRVRIAITLVIIAISLLVWIVLFTNNPHDLTMEHSQVILCGLNVEESGMTMNISSISSQMLAWLLMVMAMMLPKLILPVRFIFMRSLKRVRVFFSILFVLAYLAIWMFAGVFLISAITYIKLLSPMSYMPALGALIIVLIWQFSPIKQRFLNLGHEHRNLAAFGWAAVRDVLHFGVMHGIWCVGAGWLLMSFPMLLPQGHMLAMGIVAFIMIGEHLEHPRIPKWRLNFRLRLVKAVITQTSIRLRH
uniref:copper chaperone n=2 Tax=Roseivirga sp. TaxID=1964215 RepID=UPI004048B16E